MSKATDAHSPELARPARAPSAKKRPDIEIAAAVSLPLADAPVWEWAGTVGLHDTSGWTTNQLAGIAAGNARLYARSRLTAAHWLGEAEDAAQVAAALVDNAVRHGSAVQVPLRLALIATGELLIEATDIRPEFPGLADALKWEPAEFDRRRRGLWQARRYGATVSFAVSADGMGKTVQAVMMPTPGVAA
ncbi:hypothetical protein [Streptomyces sp. NPDC052114]|uniref:hypothetical protein n=1 Tax=unclassified Streptomyces TaxID=2593676 RepID=UPI003423B4E6